MDFSLLLGVSQHPRWLGVVEVLSSWLEIVLSLTKWFVRGSWAFPVGGYNLLLLWIPHGLEDPHIVSGCVAPTEDLSLDCQLAHDPSSGCIATMKTSFPRSKWTSIKNHVSSLAEDSILWLWLRVILGCASTLQCWYKNPHSLLYFLLTLLV